MPWEPEDCQHWSLLSMRRDAWLADEETLRLFTALDHSSISSSLWLLWAFFCCFPERPQNAGHWPGGTGTHRYTVKDYFYYSIK